MVAWLPVMPARTATRWMRYCIIARSKTEPYQVANVYIRQVMLNGTAMERRAVDGGYLPLFTEGKKKSMVIVACPRKMVTRNPETQPERHLPVVPGG